MEALTKESIQKMLMLNQQILERGIVAIFEQQTDKDQDIDQTSDHSGRGFNRFDVQWGTYYANWIMSGKHLSGKHKKRALHMMSKYAGHLLILHHEKELAKAEQESNARIEHELANVK